MGRVVTRQQIRRVLIDILAILVALWLAPFLYLHLLRGNRLPVREVMNTWWQATVLLQIYLLYLADLYDTEQKFSLASVAARIAVAVGAMELLLVVLYFFAHYFRHSRGATLLYAPVTFLTVATGRMLASRLLHAQKHTRNVMVVCNGKPANDDLILVQAATNSTNRLRGVVCYGGGTQDVRGDVALRRSKNPGDVSRIVANEGIDELILAKGCEEHPDLVRQLVRLSYRGVLLSDAVAFFERSTGKLPCEYLDDASFLSFHIDRPKLTYAKLKRLFDVAASLLGIIVSLPVWIVVAVLVKVTSRGPIFFRQERVGLDGERFTVLKFRTMVHNAEAQTGPRWATEDDPRITRVGRFLRKTRIDELPQLINVLKGEMSLIGPRPERQCFVKEFEQEIPYYRERFAVRPGITGWAQVHQGYAAGTEETKLKLSYDLFYLKNQSITLDLLIAFMTAKKMCRAGGR